jgi:hypothetical protein
LNASTLSIVISPISVLSIPSISEMTAEVPTFTGHGPGELVLGKVLAGVDALLVRIGELALGLRCGLVAKRVERRAGDVWPHGGPTVVQLQKGAGR